MSSKRHEVLFLLAEIVVLFMTGSSDAGLPLVRLKMATI